MMEIFRNIIELLSFVYLLGLFGTFDILWPLKQIPSYNRWQEEKNKKHEVEMLELKLKEQELLRIEYNLEKELYKSSLEARGDET